MSAAPWHLHLRHDAVIAVAIDSRHTALLGMHSYKIHRINSCDTHPGHHRKVPAQKKPVHLHEFLSSSHPCATAGHSLAAEVVAELAQRWYSETACGGCACRIEKLLQALPGLSAAGPVLGQRVGADDQPELVPSHCHAVNPLCNLLASPALRGVSIGLRSSRDRGCQQVASAMPFSQSAPHPSAALIHFLQPRSLSAYSCPVGSGRQRQSCSTV